MILVNFCSTIKFSETKVPSVNELYKINYNSKHLYKNPEVVDFQYNLSEMASKTILGKVKLISSYVIECDVNFQFILGTDRKFWTLDTSNMLKASEDALVKVTTIDDSKHRAVSSTKIKNSTKSDSILISYLALTSLSLQDLSKIYENCKMDELEFHASIHYHTFSLRYQSVEEFSFEDKLNSYPTYYRIVRNES